MSDERTVLLLGGTGRTGGRVLRQLLDRGVSVHAIVRSASRLPEGVARDPRLTVTQADLLSLSDDELRRHVAGCDAVVSCLGHNMSLKGMFGAPRDLVTRAATRVCRAIEALRPAEPVKFILMSSVSVNRSSSTQSRSDTECLHRRGYRMKWRSMVLVVAAAAALLLAAGCAKPQPTVVLGEKDAGRVVEVGAGQQFTVRLPSNATTGFRWVVADLGPVTQVGESVYAAPQESGIVGAGGTEVFTFKTGSSGPGELKLEYRRPWEKGSAAEKTWSVTVR